nr:olfactory receptor 1009-like [Pelodiscus sinensis]|eukprot:XP_025040256.1 olfactory receptor 1009-like [Pelodiscus sinensis]
MIFLITIDSRLHTPMYFFLRILSFSDLCYSSVIVPQMLQIFIAERKSISRTACAVQMYFFLQCVDIECLLLAVMAYDRYVAICNPLLYTVIMSRQRCNQLVAGVCVVGLVDSLILTCSLFWLSFCSSNIIQHFFCDYAPLLLLSCSDTHTCEILIFASTCYIIVSSIVTILVSYVCIFSTILRIRSAEGRYKAFSTCASHLCAVGMFHGTQLYICFQPISTYSIE